MINQPMTPKVRLVMLEPTQFHTPRTKPNLNVFLNALSNLNNNNQKFLFPQSMTTDIEKKSSTKNLLEKNKQSFSKTSTPKIKRKKIKKKSSKLTKKNKKGCKCKKTHCTRLHCICFREGGYCNESCNCNNCYNQPKFKEMISHIRELTEEINPLAFKSKIQIIETKSGQKIHNRGCSCTKNNCKKNYCECYKNGLPCSPLCKCENCKNCLLYTSPSPRDS